MLAFDNVKFDNLLFINAEQVNVTDIQTVFIIYVGGKIEFPMHILSGSTHSYSIVYSH